MIILDTQVVSQLQIGGKEDLDRLDAKLKALGESDLRITVVSPYEQLLDCIKKIKLDRNHVERDQIRFYTLSNLMNYYARYWPLDRVLPFDEAAVSAFRAIPAKIVRKVKVWDSAIAAIAMTHQGTLISANRRDFELIPGLRFETW